MINLVDCIDTRIIAEQNIDGSTETVPCSTVQGRVATLYAHTTNTAESHYEGT